VKMRTGGAFIEEDCSFKTNVKTVVSGYWQRVAISTDAFYAELILDQYSERLKLMSFQGPFQRLDSYLKKLAKENRLTKLIVYAHEKDVQQLQSSGYEVEGRILGYYSGEDCYILSHFTSDEREKSPDKEERFVVNRCAEKAGKARELYLREGYNLRIATADDAPQMAKMYAQGFQMYPTPLHDGHYLIDTMESNVLYLLVEKEGRFVSVASAEMDFEHLNAEITDCLTIPEERRKGFIKMLIKGLENEVAARGFVCSYTLCRAKSHGINAAFSAMGYTYTGRLVNNCRIVDGFEDMNIWCKQIKPDS